MDLTHIPASQPAIDGQHHGQTSADNGHVRLDYRCGACNDKLFYPIKSVHDFNALLRSWLTCKVGNTLLPEGSKGYCANKTSRQSSILVD